MDTSLHLLFVKLPLQNYVALKKILHRREKVNYSLLKYNIQRETYSLQEKSLQYYFPT